jgi:hypothetical protein
MTDQDDGFKEVPSSRPAWTNNPSQPVNPQQAAQSPQSAYQPAQSSQPAHPGQPGYPTQQQGSYQTTSYQAPQQGYQQAQSSGSGTYVPPAQGQYQAAPQGYQAPSAAGQASGAYTPPTQGGYQPSPAYGQSSYGQTVYNKPKKKGLSPVLIILLILVALGCIAVLVVAGMLLSGKWELQLFAPAILPFV